MTVQTFLPLVFVSYTYEHKHFARTISNCFAKNNKLDSSVILEDLETSTHSKYSLYYGMKSEMSSHGPYTYQKVVVKHTTFCYIGEKEDSEKFRNTNCAKLLNKPKQTYLYIL